MLSGIPSFLLLFLASSHFILANANAAEQYADDENTAMDNVVPRINFSGKPNESAVGLSAVNAALRDAGCWLDIVYELPSEMPDGVQSLLLKADSGQALDVDFETPIILHHYALNRTKLLAIIEPSGREPVIPGGGAMATEEEGVPPYPKLYDLSSMGPPETRIKTYRKFGRLHVNSVPATADDDEIGVDEVMQIIEGGPFVWFFQHPDPEFGVMKVYIPAVGPGEPGWTLTYPGLTPHGAFMDADTGLIVAYIVGPPVWQMQYSNTSNPWVDFTPEIPLLMDTPLDE